MVLGLLTYMGLQGREILSAALKLSKCKEERVNLRSAIQYMQIYYIFWGKTRKVKIQNSQ